MINQFRALSMEELCDRLCENKTTLIVYHVRPDGDAIGSAFSLRELLRMMGIPAICACSDEIPDRLQFLTDGVQGSVLPEEGLELDAQRVISVDSASPQQLGELFLRVRRSVDLMIDHHGTGTVYADHYIDSDSSATGEIIYEIAKELVKRGKIEEIPPRVINGVYAAICSDTGCFRYANTTPKTLRYGAELLEAGAAQQPIHQGLFDAKSVKQVRAEGEAGRRLRLYEGGRIASVTFPYSSKFALSLSDEDLETIIEIPRSIQGVEVAVSIRQPKEEGSFKVSMRSSSEVDVAAVCASFGGGGHKKAAGCTIEAPNVGAAEEKILEALRKKMK